MNSNQQIKKTVLLAGHEAELLCTSKKGNGQHLVAKLIWDGKAVVVKCYGLKRTFLRTIIRQYTSPVFTGKSSVSISSRHRTERKILQLWHREGFDVPAILDIPLLSEIPQPCLAMEWIQGPTLAEFFRCSQTPFPRKQQVMENFVNILGMRHKKALNLNEPRLLFEHPGFKHVLLSGQRMVHFDFEITFIRKKNIERLIRREVAGFLYSLVKSSRRDSPELVNIFITCYPEKHRIKEVVEDLQKFGTVPVINGLDRFHKLFMLSSKYRKISRSARVFNLEERMG